MTLFSEVLTAAGELEIFCRAQGWRFCFIGGLAVQRWGMPRFTQDVDLTLLTGIGSEEAFIGPLLQQFVGRTPTARKFALQHRVLLARTASGVDLDIALGALPFEERAVGRATPWQPNDQVTLTTCSAEDLIVQKAFADRERDWADVESVLARQRGHLNLGNIRADLKSLVELTEESDSLTKFERMLARMKSKSRRKPW